MPDDFRGLRQRIAERERVLERDRRKADNQLGSLRRRWRRMLVSPAGLLVAFGGGVGLGLLSGRAPLAPVTRTALPRIIKMWLQPLVLVLMKPLVSALVLRVSAHSTASAPADER